MAQGRREIHEIPHARIVQEQDALWRAAHGLAIARRRKGRLQFLHQCRHVEVAALGDMLIRLFHGRLQRILRTVLQLGLAFVIAMAQPGHEPGRLRRRQPAVRHALLQRRKEIRPRRLRHWIEAPLPQHPQELLQLRRLHLMQGLRMLREPGYGRQPRADVPRQPGQMPYNRHDIIERFGLPQHRYPGNAVDIVEHQRTDITGRQKKAGDGEQAVLLIDRGGETNLPLCQELAAEKFIPRARDGACAVKLQPCRNIRRQQIRFFGG